MDENIKRIKGIREDYINTFKTEEGQRVLADLEKICFFKTTTFNSDLGKLAYNEGARSVLLHIKTIMTLDVDELIRLSERSQQDG